MSDITREDVGYLTMELAEVRRAIQDVAVAIFNLTEFIKQQKEEKEKCPPEEQN